MKKTILLLLLCLSAGTLFSQKEVYFSNLSPDSIKVESMRGLELNWTIEPISAFHISNRFNPTLIPIFIGYFNEKRIASFWTLKSTVGFYNVFSKLPVYQKDSVYGGYYYSSLNAEYRNSYSLILHAGVEPRWYFDFYYRYKNGKANLNSGWFLSFPFALQTTLLQTPDPIFNPSWLPNYFNIDLTLVPTIGYRQAIFKQFILEGSLGIGINSSIYKNYTNQLSIGSPELYSQLSLKAAYTFK